MTAINIFYLGVLAGSCLFGGMWLLSSRYRELTLVQKAKCCECEMLTDGKFYYIVPEHKYVMMEIAINKSSQRL